MYHLLRVSAQIVGIVSQLFHEAAVGEVKRFMEVRWHRVFRAAAVFQTAFLICERLVTGSSPWCCFFSDLASQEEISTSRSYTATQLFVTSTFRGILQ